MFARSIHRRCQLSLNELCTNILLRIAWIVDGHAILLTIVCWREVNKLFTVRSIDTKAFKDERMIVIV